MKMDCDVSGMITVIVPVYKTEAYLARCVDSILNQTYTNLEVILIDDGSPDRAGEICDRYAQKDPRVRVIHQANQGVSTARNVGLDAARGEYVSFIDSDDWIDPCTYQEVITDMMNHQVDCVFFGINLLDAEDNVIEVWSPKQNGVVDNISAIRQMYGMVEIPSYGCGGCNKVFRKNVLAPNRFVKNLSAGEDALFFTEVVLSCNRIFLDRNTYYQYLQHEESATHQPELSQQKVDTIKAWLRIAEVFKSNCSELHRKACSNVFQNGFRMLFRVYMSDKSMPEDLQKSIAPCWKYYLLFNKQNYLSRLKCVITYGLIRLRVPKSVVSYVFNMRRTNKEG